MPRSLTGEHYHYYGICSTKLWYHHHRILYAQENEFVKLGKILSETAYSRDDNVAVGTSKFDLIRHPDEQTIEISEIKRSSTYQEADRLQLLHYLSLLAEAQSNGSDRELIGKLRYPRENTVVTIKWTDKTAVEYEEATAEILSAVSDECPSPERIPACRKCSMREFCFA
ncbi:CRISPR-associated protein Cas4 [Natronococcus amylolyticus DSM 10524]|uniref:CRISPR-associated protein Cas4 n=1 Tax=Natronococcus amylolyticus DSM 10524 TaxID=1227497 RepID=L9X3D6_9EURY|nr:CRISPR-associated protein Cas4 [Natronococcus amylolyticus DSM 10524]